MEFDTAQLLTAIGIAIVGATCYRWKRRRASLPLPPGPKGWPILGNLLQLPTEAEWVTYHDWCKQLGTDILYINAAGQDIIILDSVEATSVVMDKNATLCSSRPRLPMVRELIGWESGFQFKDYTDTWREHRKIFHQEMGPTGAPRLRLHQIRATRRFLKRLMLEATGANIVNESRNLTGDIVISITYGFELTSETQHYVQLSKNAIDPVVEALTPGMFLVDIFPLLKYVPSWVPGASFKRKAQVWSDMRQDMFNKGFDQVKKKMAAGSFVPSFVQFSLEGSNGQGDVKGFEDIIKSVGGSMYAAGGDTTLAVVTTAIHVFLNHPEAVKRAQREMDEVIGAGNLPTFEDEKALPFTKSLILETQRWKDPFPLGLPHVATDDVIYKGYRIPKGSIVMGNTWGILKNEETFKDAHLFKPDRYLSADGQSIDPSVPEPSIAIFGFGRRACPGRYVAEASIWIILSSLLAAFNFHHVDKLGGPDHSYQTGCLSIPNEFKARFEPRSAALRKLIEDFQEN